MLRDSHSLSIERRPQLPSIMINFNLREVAPGEAIRADDWNALVGLLRDLTDESNARELSVGDGLELHKSSSGSTLLLDVGDFREEPETTEYEHPFKISATWTDAGKLQICCARGEAFFPNWPHSSNYYNRPIQEEQQNFTGSGSTDYNVILWIALTRNENSNGLATYLPADAIVSIQASGAGDPPLSGDGFWQILIGTVSADHSKKLFQIDQRWRSDISIPQYI